MKPSGDNSIWSHNSKRLNIKPPSALGHIKLLRLSTWFFTVLWLSLLVIQACCRNIKMEFIILSRESRAVDFKWLYNKQKKVQKNYSCVQQGIQKWKQLWRTDMDYFMYLYLLRFFKLLNILLVLGKSLDFVQIVLFAISVNWILLLNEMVNHTQKEFNMSWAAFMVFLDKFLALVYLEDSWHASKSNFQCEVALCIWFAYFKLCFWTLQWLTLLYGRMANHHKFSKEIYFPY